MRAFERETTERLSRLETKLDLLLRLVNGREQPGMVQKMEQLEKRLLSLEIRGHERKNHLGKIAAAVGFAVNAGIAIGAWFR